MDNLSVGGINKTYKFTKTEVKFYGTKFPLITPGTSQV